jgi:PiT family inorganic phosphate transporter
VAFLLIAAVALLSFANGANDNFKGVATLWGASLTSYRCALAWALGAARVARSMSKQITPMAAPEAVVANLVAASLVTLASLVSLPVSTTHVTSGGLFGIGLLRRSEADWRRVRDIVLS